MVEHQVDEIGGFEGIKRIAETTNNPILKNMVSICENTAKQVGERNAKEAKGDPKKVDFSLNKIELEEYDYRKKEMGSESIVNNIKDKVLQVVEDEQKLSSDKQMVMDEIQNKVSELEAPVEEAMKFIFETKVEEETLFNSMMRLQYKQLLETNSSAIFESFDYKELEDPLFENEEFEMSDIDDEDLDDDDKAEIEDMFLNECQKIYEAEDYEYEEALESFYRLLLEGSDNIKSYVQVEHFKSLVRKAQNELEYIEEKFVRNIQKHARKISNKKLDKSIVQWEKEIEETRAKIKREKDPVCLDDYKEDLRTLEAELKALKAEKSHRGKQLKIAREANPYMKPTTESVEDVKKKLNNMVEVEEDSSASDGDVANMPKKEVNDKEMKEISEEVILCPTCGKEECTCKVAKESYDCITESLSDMKDKFMVRLNQKKDAKEVKTVIKGFKKELNEIYEVKVKTEADHVEYIAGLTMLLKKYRAAASQDHNPDRAKVLNDFCDWLEDKIKRVGKKIADNVEVNVESSLANLMDQYVDKLEEICEAMDVIVESHENAKNNVMESLNRNINDDLIFVPYLQTNDVNLNNLEFIYKTKLVCESLKNNLKFIETEQEANTLQKAVDMNIVSINETLDIIKSREDMAYKVKILNAGRNYLSKINNVLEKNSERYVDEICESTGVYKTPEDVERIFNIAKEFYVIESTNKDLMELVMAEAIVDYTILETFNTLYLLKFDRETVRQMSRKNISK